MQHQPTLPSWYTSVAALGHREIHSHARACWAAKTCAAEAVNCSFKGAGIICGLERHTISLVHAHIPTDAVVLEMGARFGTVSCAISHRLNNSGLRVSVEPDPSTFESLQANLAANDCKGLAVQGTVSKQTLFQFKPAGVVATGYGNSKVLPTNCTEMAGYPFVFGHSHGKWWCEPVPHYSTRALENELSRSVGRHVRFNVLVVDCEGCWRPFMREEAAFLRDRALEYIIYETDERDPKVIEEVCALGFGVVSNQMDCMTPKAPGLAQVLFRRQPLNATPLDCRSLWAKCDTAYM